MHSLRVWDVTDTGVPATVDGGCTLRAKSGPAPPAGRSAAETGSFRHSRRIGRHRRPRGGAIRFAALRRILRRPDPPWRHRRRPGRPSRPGLPETAKPWKYRPRLDVPGGRALVCGVPDDGAGELLSGRPRRRPCQRSFNWQSTAFVMRGLRVRLPPLAVRESRRHRRRFSRPWRRRPDSTFVT